jgi:hypothetical protein
MVFVSVSIVIDGLIHDVNIIKKAQFPKPLIQNE